MNNITATGKELRYDFGWRSNFEILWNNVKFSVLLGFQCDDESNDIVQNQLEAFFEFDLKQSEIIKNCHEIAEKYLTERGVAFDDSSTYPTEIYFPLDCFVENRVFCVLLVSPIEPELGLGIRFVDGFFQHFGTQDDVL